MSAHQGRVRLRQAIQSQTSRAVERASELVQLALVVDTTDLTLELLESRATLYSDEIDLTQMVRQYDRDAGIAEGDTAVVVHKRTGGELQWLVVAILSDGELPPPPSPPVPTKPDQITTGTSFPTAPTLGEIRLRTDMSPRRAYMYTGDGPASGWTPLNGLG